MTIKQAKMLMKVEKICIEEAPNCNRKCESCPIVQDVDTLLEAYQTVIDTLEELEKREKTENIEFLEGELKQYKVVLNNCKEGLNV